jgi:hypothetical protein
VAEIREVIEQNPMPADRKNMVCKTPLHLLFSDSEMRKMGVCAMQRIKNKRCKFAVRQIYIVSKRLR